MQKLNPMPRKNARASILLVFLISTFGLSACDDLSVISAFKTSEVQKQARAKGFIQGDSLPMESPYSRFCLISPLNDLRDYATGNYDVFFSESFYLVLTKMPDGREQVERIHRSWITTPESASLCVSHPERIIIDSVGADGRLHLRVSEGE